MKSFQIKYVDAGDFEKQLSGIKDYCERLPYSNVVFYFTWAEEDAEKAVAIIDSIGQVFPEALYYGNEASGNIQEGDLSFGVTVTCYVFDTPGTCTKLVWVADDAEVSSVDDLWEICRKEDGLKAVELIPSAAYLQGHKLDNIAPGLNDDVVVFGGAAINYTDPGNAAGIIAKGHDLSFDAMAAILYFGEELNVSATYIVGWKGLGRYMTVTRSANNILYEIDGQPAGSIFEKYLNIKDDPTANLVFPLLIREDGYEYLRNPQAFLPDGTLRMIVNVDEGIETRIAYGDKNTILNNLHEQSFLIDDFNPQVLKAFSCTARRLFWGNDEISKETLPLQQIAPIAGFYTGGELLGIGGKLRVFNSTLVIVCFREGEPVQREKVERVVNIDHSLISRITRFVGKISEEQEEALKKASEEQRRNDMLHEIIHSMKWSFFLNANDEITGLKFSKELEKLAEGVDITSDGYAWTNALHPEDKVYTMTAFSAAILDHTCQTPYDVTYRMYDAGGNIHWFHSAGRVIRDADGSGEFFGIHIEITDQLEKQLENQRLLQEALEMAQAANKAKTLFLNNMSHDIRTPMNAIKGFTSMAKKYADNKKKVAEYLDKIDISGQQLLMLINQVLEMSRIEAGKIEFNEKPVSISAQYESLVTILSEQAKSQELYFHSDLVGIEHNNILADEARMSQITLNIAGNALKYTPCGGSIDFTLREIPCEREGYARFVFTVSDTGIGMSKEYLKVLFEPFTREKSTTVSHIQGSGLGMSIVKSLVDLLGGTIKVKSELGKGTRFDVTIDFKIDAEERSKADLSQKKSADKGLKGMRVLVVEDNALNREIAKFILLEHGLIVEEVDDGDLAVMKVKEHAMQGDFYYYDFILMDIQMPRMNGIDATKAIRAIPGPKGVHIPIIAMTANAFEEDRQSAIEAGMDDHVAKPIDIQQLIDAMMKMA